MAIFLIMITLIIQLNSVKKVFVVLNNYPLALIGVFFGLAVVRVNLSFPGLIGVLALFGIVVKNAIILVDKISLNLRSGIPLWKQLLMPVNPEWKQFSLLLFVLLLVLFQSLCLMKLGVLWDVPLFLV